MPSGSLCATRTVKPNQALAILGHPYPGSCHKEAFLELLENELLAIDKSGMTPGQRAAISGNTVGLMAMLDYKAVRHMLSWRTSPMWLAIKNGHTECVAALLSSKKTAGVLFKYSYFHCAVAFGQLDCLKLLVQKYPDSFTTRNPFLSDIIHLIPFAISTGHDKILQYLLEQPLFINRLTKMEYASEFVCKKNSTFAKLIRDAREKVKLPFCAVKHFDKKLFQQAWQREKNKIAKKNTLVLDSAVLDR